MTATALVLDRVDRGADTVVGGGVLGVLGMTEADCTAALTPADASGAVGLVGFERRLPFLRTVGGTEMCSWVGLTDCTGDEPETDSTTASSPVVVATGMGGCRVAVAGRVP